MWKMELSLSIMNTSFFPLINIMYLQEERITDVITGYLTVVFLVIALKILHGLLVRSSVSLSAEY